MAKKAEVETADSPAVSVFSKEQIIKSMRYQAWRDILSVLLEDGQSYSHDEITARLSEFLKGKVK